MRIASSLTPLSLSPLSPLSPFHRLPPPQRDPDNDLTDMHDNHYPPPIRRRPRIKSIAPPRSAPFRPDLTLMLQPSRRDPDSSYSYNSYLGSQS